MFWKWLGTLLWKHIYILMYGWNDDDDKQTTLWYNKFQMIGIYDKWNDKWNANKLPHTFYIKQRKARKALRERLLNEKINIYVVYIYFGLYVYVCM